MSKATYPLELSASLKREAERLAKLDGVSLNQWIGSAWRRRSAPCRRPPSFCVCAPREPTANDCGTFSGALPIAPRTPATNCRRSDGRRKFRICFPKNRIHAKVAACRSLVQPCEIAAGCLNRFRNAKSPRGRIPSADAERVDGDGATGLMFAPDGGRVAFRAKGWRPRNLADVETLQCCRKRRLTS
jgi:hypothetical protein